MIINPTLTKLKKGARECLYEYDEVRGTITENFLLVWFDDIHHVDFMKELKIGYKDRYDIRIHCDKNIVVMTKMYDRVFTDKDVQNVTNDKNLKILLGDFKVFTKILDY